MFGRGCVLVGLLAVMAPAWRCEGGLLWTGPLRPLVEADWAAQERRAGRTAGSPESIDLALRRARQLLTAVKQVPGTHDFRVEEQMLADAPTRAERSATLDKARRLNLYNDIRMAGRMIAMANPLVKIKPLIFMERRRFICQMLHEYMGYYYDGISGGGVYVLENPWWSMEVKDLIGGRLPQGNYTTLSLSHDGKTIYFGFADAAAQKPDFYHPTPERRYFHIFAMAADGSNLRQLTDGPNDDFDPCPLPDGGVAFMSSRRGGGFTRCNNPWEPLPACTLHRMDGDGRNVRTLSFHETNEWHPSVLNDGRIAYIRWDYVDRSAANFHGLWACNPDGSNPSAIFGNYTMKINACYQPRAIPGSNKIAFIAGAHHADVGGSVVILDPQRTSLDPQSGEDRLDAVQVVTPEVCFPESAGWPKGFFHAPWPLSEDYFLVGFGYDTLPSMSSGNAKDSPTGIYYLDRFGNMELLYRAEGISCMYPIPLNPRVAPPVVPSSVDSTLGDEGEYMVANVRESFLPMPAGREIKELRVFQVLPKSTHIANEPRIGHANAEGARMLLGTAPVEADGSAYFRAPARKPLYFQAVDERGHAVQSMRSVTYLQPGERRGCVGCHEGPGRATSPRTTLAMQRGPSVLRPGPDGTRPFSYPRLVQPVLDRSCVQCHDGSAGEGKSKLALTGEPSRKGTFTRSYDNLKPYLRWYEWGGASITQIATPPGRIGADESKLLKVLEDAHHGGKVKLPAEDLARLCIWLDGNVPFYGTYEKEAQAAQRRGEAVGEPAMQ